MQRECKIVESLTLDYIIGLFDGEGCISIGFASKYDYKKSRRSWWPYVKVTIANSNLAVLRKIRGYFKMGKIYTMKPEWFKGTRKGGDCYRLDIMDVNDVLRFFDVIDQIVFIKREEVGLGKEACRYILENRPHGQGWSEVKLVFFKANFVDKLPTLPNSRRAKGRGRKRKIALLSQD